MRTIGKGPLKDTRTSPYLASEEDKVDQSESLSDQEKKNDKSDVFR
jgi:hypothetical protein